VIDTTVTKRPDAKGVNPYCADDNHGLYVGCVAGIAWRNGLLLDFVDDEDGVHTDRLVLHLTPEVTITFIVPPPPPDWKLTDWLPD
jgi:hypothetical protein